MGGGGRDREAGEMEEGGRGRRDEGGKGEGEERWKKRTQSAVAIQHYNFLLIPCREVIAVPLRQELLFQSSMHPFQQTMSEQHL